MASKFTFKRHKRETGLASVVHSHPWVDIKLAGKVVGSIRPPSAFTSDTWRVMFMVVSEAEKCGWAWAMLKAHYESEQEAREYIVANSERIQNKLRLHARVDRGK